MPRSRRRFVSRTPCPDSSPDLSKFWLSDHEHELSASDHELSSQRSVSTGVPLAGGLIESSRFSTRLQNQLRERPLAVDWKGRRSPLARPSDEAHRPLLQREEVPEFTTVDMIDGRDRLQRLPSGGGSSSFNGSLFSTVEGTTTTTADGRSLTADGDETGHGSWAQKARESYYLQLTLVARLTSQASLADQPYLLQDSTQEMCGTSPHSGTMSYRLWVNGCLSYSDKISNGFYNIMGMDPFLWAMCNE